MCNCNDKKMYHNYLNNCNCNKGCGCEECENCDEVLGCPVVLSDTCVFYRGTDVLTHLGVNPDEDLRTILTKINDVISQINPTVIDFDSFNLRCYTVTSNLETFIQETIDKVCALERDLVMVHDMLIENTNSLENAINLLSFVNLEGVPEPIPLNDYNQQTHITLQSILGQINLAGLEWDTCFTPTFTPANIKEGFELLLGMFCSLQSSVNGYQPDTKKVKVSALDNTEGFLSEKIVSNCLNVTVDNTVPTNPKVKIEPKNKFVQYVFNPTHFSVNNTETTDCKDSYTISLASLPTPGLTSIGLGLTTPTSDVMEVSNSPLTSNGNMTLGFKSNNGHRVLLTNPIDQEVHFGQIETGHIVDNAVTMEKLVAPTLNPSFIGGTGNAFFEEVQFSGRDFTVESGELEILRKYACVNFSEVIPFSTAPIVQSVNNVIISSTSFVSEYLIPSVTSGYFSVTAEGLLTITGTLKIQGNIDVVSNALNGRMYGEIIYKLFDLPSCMIEPKFEINVDNEILLEDLVAGGEKISISSFNADIYKQDGNTGVYLIIKIHSDNPDYLTEFTKYINFTTTVLV